MFQKRLIAKAIFMVENKDNESTDDELDYALWLSLKKLKKQWYLFQLSQYRPSPSKTRFALDLDSEGVLLYADNPPVGVVHAPGLSDNKFL